MKRHLVKINDTVKEIHDKLKQQYDRPLNEDPILYVSFCLKKNHEMVNLAEELRDEYYLLKMTPRPKNVKKQKTVIEEEEIKPEEKS